MQTNPSKPHSVLAAFFDFYFLALCFGALISLLQLIIGNIFAGQIFIVISFVIVFLLFLIFYHWKFKNKVQFLSFGERVTGKILKDGKKEWHNPYKANRFFLFLTMFFGLFSIASIWDNQWLGMPISIQAFAFNLIKMFFILWPILLIGRGKISHSFIAFSYFSILSILAFWLYISAKPEDKMINLFFLGGFIYGFIALAYLLTFIYYRNKVTSHHLVSSTH